MIRHVLVTNDFPPKVGGIQSYLWELWRRLPPDDFGVLTTAYEGASAFDALQPFRVVRTSQRVLLPTRSIARRIDQIAADCDAELVVLDPGLPIGWVGPALSRPYAVVMHGSELVGRIPIGGRALARVLRGAVHVIAAGEYPAAETRRLTRGAAPPITVIPPGVDVERFRPLTHTEWAEVRSRYGLPLEGRVVVGVSRLVPRKGFDVLIEAAARLHTTHPDVVVAIASDGRDRSRLERLVRARAAPVRFLGRVPDADLPGIYGCADVFAMLCRGNRWFGAEQEGFGIVFVEAAACGVPQVAGRSGGAADAVADGATGLVVDDPTDPGAAAAALARLLDDTDLRGRLATTSRQRIEAEFTYDGLSDRLRAALDSTASERH
jgi:phosphatidylinositol alpha-1,6-mannosyltransferase